MIHVLLCGDSIFANDAYVPHGADVLSHLRRHLVGRGNATLLAFDGASVCHVVGQLTNRPGDASHLFISAGGNDALLAEGILDEAVLSVGEALMRLAEVREVFRAAYSEMLDAVTSIGLPISVCTIYDPCFPDPGRQVVAVAALALFNDVILREACARGLAIIDLRLLFDEASDYANPIEPSAKGGAKIAQAVAALAKQTMHRLDTVG